MQNVNSNNKRIIKNTIFLYFRMFLIMIVSLYTVRVLLNTLGQLDYGLYNVTGGIIVMFSFLTHVLTSASQRFFSYELGTGDSDKLSKTFSVILMFYIIVVCAIIILAETIGLWFLHHKMTIPPDRVLAVDWIYQFSILTFCWKILTAPHQAIIISNEKMSIYAQIGIAEVLLQLCLVLSLQYVYQDRLIIYGAFMFCIALLVNGIYICYSHIKYKYIRFIFTWDKALIKTIISYSGWTLFGALASVARSQGINIILNVYFSPLINTARGIAHNVNSSVSSFAGNFYVAVKPQIVKYYAQQDLVLCYNLIFKSTKFSYCLIFALTFPTFVYVPEILTLWLGEYPVYTVLFTRLILVVSLVESLANPLITFNQATGNIKIFQIIVSLLYIVNLPLSIVAFEIGYGPTAAFIISILISICANASRLIIINRQHAFPLISYCSKVLFPLLVTTLLCVIMGIAWRQFSPCAHSILNLLGNVSITIIMCGIGAWFVALNKSERKWVMDTIKSKIYRQ